MSYPKTRAELKQYAGTWTEAELELNDFPEETKFIVGREDIPNLLHRCILCHNITYLDNRDIPVLKQGAVPICSECYLKSLTKVKP